MSRALTLDEHGVWRAASVGPLSYPVDGNARCFGLEDASFWFRHRNDCILAAIRRFPPVGPILDVGGGNGYVSRRIIDEGFDAILLEPGPTGAINAKTKRRLPEVICAKLEDVPFPAGVLSAVGMFDVLEHIEDHEAMVHQLQRLLTPGGLLYLTVPAHQWLWSLSDVTAQHFRRFSRRVLRELFEPDFEIAYLSSFFGPLVLPILLLRSFPYVVGVARRRNPLSPSSEHGTGGGFSPQLLARWLRSEVPRIASGRPIRMGASWLLVARKRTGRRDPEPGTLGLQ